jgi:excisionase family DNA binding protein
VSSLSPRHQAPARPAGIASEPYREPSDGKHGERLAYSVDEAARALGLSRGLIYNQLRTGRLGSIKVGGRRIIAREHIDKFLAGR